jgi:hypothetical protein
MTLYSIRRPDLVNESISRSTTERHPKGGTLRMVTALCMLVVAATACRDDALTSNNATPQEGVTITPATATLTLGSSVQLSAQLFDEEGNPVSGQTFSWWTPDASIATVDGNGVVSAVGLGTVAIAAITADQSQSGFADITIVSEGGGVGEGGGGEGGGGEGGGGSGGGSAGGTSGANILDVPANNAEAGSREPAGLTPIGLSHFYSMGTFMGIDSSNRAKHELPEGGVHFYGGGVEGGTAGSRAHTVTGFGGQQVLELLMPQGCMGSSGNSCGNMLTHAAAKSAAEPNQQGYFREMYVRFGWHVDGNYWVHPAGNKVASPMWRNSQNGGVNGLGWIRVWPKGGDRWPGQRIKDAPQLPTLGWAYGHQLCGYPENHRGSVQLPYNKDVVIEIWVRMATGPCANDGAIKLWLDGQLTVDLSNVPTWDPNAGGGNNNLGGGDTLWGMKIQHILGGLCSTDVAPCPSSNMYMQHDYIYMSAKN